MNKIFPRIYIIGAGAIGKALAVLLIENKKKAILVKSRETSKNSHPSKISMKLNEKKVIEHDIDIVSLSTISNLDGIIVIATKSFTNPDLANLLLHKTGNSPIVLLQNGLGVEKPFLELKFPELYRCVLFVTSQSDGQNAISYKPVMPSPIGTIKSNNSNLEAIVDQLNCPLFEFEMTKSIQNVTWEKVIINCVFNSICPILEVDNGIFFKNKEAFELSKIIVKECLELAREYDIILEETEIFKRIITISEMSNGQLISTLQDINNKSRTEIDTLNLEMASLAEDLGKPHLVTNTKILGELVKLKSELV